MKSNKVTNTTDFYITYSNMIFWMEHLFCRPKTQEELMQESIAQAVIKVLLGILVQLTLVDSD